MGMLPLAALYDRWRKVPVLGSLAAMRSKRTKRPLEQVRRPKTYASTLVTIQACADSAQAFHCISGKVSTISCTHPKTTHLYNTYLIIS